MAKEPEEAGHTASEGSGDGGNQRPAPDSPQPEAVHPQSTGDEPGQSVPMTPAPETGEMAGGSRETSPTTEDPFTETPAESENRLGIGDHSPASDPGREEDYSHHDDGHGHDPHHDHGHDEYSEYHHHDPYHDDPYHQEHQYDHTSGEPSPKADYYHEPGDGKADEPEESTFEGLFGGGDDGEGGPVKSFLEHLEDLRWVLIKCIVAVLIAMFVCLAAAPVLVSVLKWPLLHPLVKAKQDQQVLQVQFGTNHWNVTITTNVAEQFQLGTNRVTAIELQPVLVGTNLVLGVKTSAQILDAETVAGPQLKIYDPKEVVTLALKLALYGGLGIASPLVFLFLGEFLVPALKRREKEYLYKGVIIGAGLFVLGALFAYFVLLRVAYYFIVEFSSWLGFVSDEWRASEFIGFTVVTMVGLGLAFELPVVLLTLVKIGILDYRRLNTFRPYWFILNLVASAFITPTGDPFTMLLMAIPIHILYEISVLIAWYWDRQDRKRLAAEKPGES